MATQEQLDLRRKWVEALRSGKYKQGKSYLRSKDDEFCCLGVLCDVANVPSTIGDQGYHFRLPDDNFTSSALLGDNLRALVGLNGATGSFNDKEGSNSLANLNDEGNTFSEIADVIESNPPGLFAD